MDLLEIAGADTGAAQGNALVHRETAGVSQLVHTVTKALTGPDLCNLSKCVEALVLQSGGHGLKRGQGLRGVAGNIGYQGVVHGDSSDGRTYPRVNGNKFPSGL